MESIGERLEEARKRKGISLREAAEGTKIRSDFLGYIEQNKFDFDLPELYKRGFIKNYARFLKLDSEKIITDYSAQLLSNTRNSHKGSAELFGQMEIKKSAEAEESNSADNDNSYGRITAQGTEDRHDSDDESDKTFYLKIGLVFVGVLTLVFVIFGLLKAILSSGDDTSSEPDLTPPEITQPATTDPATDQDIVSSSEIRLIASGTVYVKVRQRSDDSSLYEGTMSDGQTINLTKDGVVDILFTAGENLTIESGGEKLRPSSSGIAKITLP